MTRLRVLLLLLGAIAIVALWRWSPAPDATRPTAPDPRTPLVHQAGDTQPGGWQPMSDSAFASTMTGFVIMTVRGDSLWFDFTSPDDSTVSLAMLGFIPARSLLDTAARFEAVGEGGITRLVGITSPQVMDSAVRYMDTSCNLGVEVPVRDVSGRTVHGGPAFLPGMAELLPKSLWQAEGGEAHRTVALELARKIPPIPAGADSTVQDMVDPFAESPFRVHTVFTFVIDDTDVLVGDVRRSMPHPVPGVEAAVNEQRIFIAERPANDPAAEFQLAWSNQGTDMGESADIRELETLLRLGPRKVLTFIVGRQYGDGGGDAFLARTGPGRWLQVASYYVGC